MGHVAETYDRDGWVLVPRAVDAACVDRLLAAYHRDLRPSRRKFYRQNTDRYERNTVDAHGHVTNAFLDPHNFHSVPAIREAVLEAVLQRPVLDALTAATGFGRFNLMQTMLFDKNAATVAHQDWWYLDSVPNGHLAAVWIALEDIAEEAGRFYLLSGSHRVTLHDDLRGLKHSDWLALMARYAAEQAGSLEAPALRKGDMIIWNSRTIHGALPTRSPHLSRKSLTAHFLPADLRFGNLFTVKDWVSLTPYGEHRTFANQPEYSLWNDARARLKQAAYDHPALMRLLRRLQRRPAPPG